MSIKQHSKRWYTIKRFNLGANDIASLLNVGFDDPSTIINNKINGTQTEHDATTQQLLDRGTRYEPVVRTLFEQRHGIEVKETGLKHYRHPYGFITASPDGMYTHPTDGKQVLTEFKVRRELSEKIPMKYWVQMQVQMAVWDVDRCMYVENVIIENESMASGFTHLTWENGSYYWKLQEYREHLVHRDTEWWDSVFDKICGYWSLVQQGRDQPKTRAAKRNARVHEQTTGAGAGAGTDIIDKRTKFQQRKQQTIQPYMLGNYFRNDPLLDWLNMYGPMDRRDTEVNFFLTMIRNKNREFNKLVTEYITEQYPDSTYNVCPDPFHIPADQQQSVEPHKLGFTFEGVALTEAAMQRKVPIIFNACLHTDVPHYPYPIGGRADMIVMNRYIGTLFNLFEVPDGPEDAYTVVNFKYATINLRADRVHLLNNSKQKVYKAHLWLLNLALGISQGYTGTRAYVIGRKYDFTKCGTTFRINNAFATVGTVDYDDIDASYVEDCREALNWLTDLRDSDAKHWNPFEPHMEALYPNMKNAMDHPWHTYKSEIAKAIKDITLMPWCGPRVREYAHDRGVTQWQELTPDNIIYNKGKLLEQIMKFIHINTSPTEAEAPVFDFSALLKISKRGWMKGCPCVEFYMDFEAIGSLYDDFSTFPISGNKAMIFLIGLITVDHVNGTQKYTSYLAERLDKQAEQDMILSMLDDITKARELVGQDFAPIYYWSNAENYMLKRAMGDRVDVEHKLVMTDICKAFRETKLIMPGQVGYGLKSVAKTMHAAGMISTIWDETEQIASGLNATVEAMKTYSYRSADTKSEYFRSLIDYNYVDCKVMQEIMDYLRLSLDP